MNKEIILNGKIYVLKKNQKPIDDECSRAFDKGYQRGLLKLTKENQIKLEFLKDIELKLQNSDDINDLWDWWDKKVKEVSLENNLK